VSSIFHTPHISLKQGFNRYVIGLLCLYAVSLKSQTVLSPTPDNHQAMRVYEDSLKQYSLAIAKAKTDVERVEHNKKLVSLFEKVLVQAPSVAYKFDSLRYVTRVEAPDKSFRIFTWDIEKTDGTYQYYGFIQLSPAPEESACKLFMLTDKSAEITKNPELYSSDHKKWWGMLYYKIILTQYKKKKFYTLLGWDGNDKLSNKKVIDVLTFTADGSPHFGEAIFDLEYKKGDKKTAFEFSAGTMPKRLLFEYSSQIVMSLRYNEPLNTIVFDHLAPPNSSLKGQYQFYGPDFSYDGFKWEKGKWRYIPYQDARARKTEMDKYYIAPKKAQIEEIKTE
jgi:hypothetical protein